MDADHPVFRDNIHRYRYFTTGQGENHTILSGGMPGTFPTRPAGGAGLTLSRLYALGTNDCAGEKQE